MEASSKRIIKKKKKALTGLVGGCSWASSNVKGGESEQARAQNLIEMVWESVTIVSTVDI